MSKAIKEQLEELAAFKAEQKTQKARGQAQALALSAIRIAGAEEPDISESIGWTTESAREALRALPEVTLTGYVGTSRASESRAGKPIVNLNIAVRNESSDEAKNDATWVTAECWGLTEDDAKDAGVFRGPERDADGKFIQASPYVRVVGKLDLGKAWFHRESGERMQRIVLKTSGVTAETPPNEAQSGVDCVLIHEETVSAE